MKINSVVLQSIYTYNFISKPTESYSYSSLENFEFTFNQNNYLNIDYENIKNMAFMSFNSYLDVNDTKWKKIPYETNKPINTNLDQIKCYLFKKDNVNIIAIKGTSISFIPSTLDTVKNDRFNDNMFFSCCYYKQSKEYNQYLDKNICKNDNNKICNKACYLESINIDLNYINTITNIIENIKKDINFDTETILFTGHSLGGALATIAGLKYNKQVISFDSPGTRHYVNLLGLTGNTNHIYNFGHTADSIMHGDCDTLCKTWGYNLDTECHIGNTCIYDSKKKLGYFDGIRYHQLKWIIDYILPYWETDFPECIFNKPCQERNCDKWEYI
jgi:lipase ATG15